MPTKKIKSQVISTRVTPDVHRMIKRICKKNGMSTSEYITALTVNGQVPNKMGAGGEVSAYKEVPEDLKVIFTILGASATGAVTFNVLNKHLPKDKLSEEQRQAIVILGAIGGALAGGYITSKLIED